MVTLSEFGRRAEENGGGGVDHGLGQAVLALGGGINGGQVMGRWPTLAPGSLDDGDLAVTTDYRSILAEILAKRCGLTSATSVFPGFSPWPSASPSSARSCSAPPILRGVDSPGVASPQQLLPAVRAAGLPSGAARRRSPSSHRAFAAAVRAGWSCRSRRPDGARAASNTASTASDRG